ncbi:hypothetical protein HBA54_19065 [Pelagibius litoralis]|uniref:Uncharacterized protein n=1 Tax=Pelagibius litoralis TaxID=374515 RepID=A0A967F0E1_9PROT|nr:DUF2161 family putative PD-(D/E)XK-type phosphodiesterase [Pelagibius litoralis]NIA70703.1 hypothetical protein [Pelagibius litoralis]
MRFESEEDLYAPVKAFFEGQGYEVKAEVRGCDLVARRGAEPPVVVELKTGFTLPLILQGIDRLALSDHVYLAVAVAEQPARNSLWRRERRGILKLCRRLGLGLLAVHEGGEEKPPLVEPLLDPLPYQPRPNRKRQGLLLKEFAHRVGDPNTGGMTRRPIVTAYRQNALRCAVVLQRQGATKVSEVTRTGSAQAPKILQRDVYGWFQRIERGIYELSPKGEAALETYGDVVKALEEAAAPPLAERHPAKKTRRKPVKR